MRSQRAATLKSCLASIGCFDVVAFVLANVLFSVISNKHNHYYRIANCQSHLKQLGMGFAQYANDYDEQYPVRGQDGTGWAGALYPYEKSTGMFKCPDDENKDVVTEASHSYPLSYSLNSNIFHRQGNRAVSSKLQELNHVTTMVLAFETDGTLVDMTKSDEGGIVSPSGFHSGIGNGLPPWPRTSNLTADGKQIQYACGEFAGRGEGSVYGSPRHDDASSFLCADGHVKLLRAAKVSTGRTPVRSGAQPGNAVSGTAASSDTLDDGGFTLTFSTR
ncbi:MAG TPA: hypothetical protein VGK19_17490 [Capsulimonadaceae bacterium]|jgi:hypothetical protein